MQKVFLSVIIILLSTFAMNAQLVKDGSCVTYDRVMPVNKYEIGYGAYNNVEKNCDVNYTNSTLTFYNLDFSIYKILKLNYHITGIKCLTTNQFNNDELIEFIYSYADPITSQNNTYLMNENGEVLYDFNGENFEYIFTTSSGQFKLYTTKYDSKTSTLNSTIYSLTTLLPSGVNPIRIEQKIPYPNPSKNVINLPYQLEPGKQTIMKIYDVNGKQVTAKQIDSTFDKIQLDVSGYTKGLYWYEYNGKSSKFLVK